MSRRNAIGLLIFATIHYAMSVLFVFGLLAMGDVGIFLIALPAVVLSFPSWMFLDGGGFSAPSFYLQLVANTLSWTAVATAVIWIAQRRAGTA